MSSDTLSGNPLLMIGGLPRYDLIEPRHVAPAIDILLNRAEEQMSQLEATVTPTWEGSLGRIEEIDRPFDYAWDPVSHLFGVKNSPELREAYDAVLPKIVEFGLRCSQSRPIYEACLAIRNSAEWDRLNDARRRIVEKRIQSAQLSGIDLEGAQRDEFNAIVQELSQLSTRFSNNVLDATREWELILTDAGDVEGIPESVLAMAAQSYAAKSAADHPEAARNATAQTGPWRFTLDAPSVTPFLQHCRRRELREKAYRAFVTRASSGDVDNQPLIDRILELRRRKAKLLGFHSYAELSLATKMAPGVAAVETMFETLRSAAWPGAVKDMQELQQLAEAEGFREELRHWDMAYWSERLREKKFNYTDEELRPYFPLERVLRGMFDLAGRLFDIRIRPVDGAPVWHPDVRYFHIENPAGEQIAAFYLDPCSRPENKRPGAWMDSCLGRRLIDGRVQHPVAHLVCNGTPPVGEKPSLMTFREVETLFHEFGHGLQHMLTVIDESGAAGISGVEWDAVELPSQFMENWCYHAPTMKLVSGHYQTGEPLPDELFQKICASRHFRAGTMTLRQLMFGMTDMALHKAAASSTDGDLQRSIFDVQREIVQKTSILPMLEEDRSLCTFSHIFAGGYAAGYYSYKWAEVLSADAFGAFEEAGLDNAEAVTATGRRFRDTVLALGGSRHPMDVFRAFRGRDPDPQALLRQCGLL